jgi:hypothetical protein
VLDGRPGRYGVDQPASPTRLTRVLTLRCAAVKEKQGDVELPPMAYGTVGAAESFARYAQVPHDSAADRRDYPSGSPPTAASKCVIETDCTNPVSL